MNPKISVVMPVYNGMRFMRRSLDSVLTQEYPAHEIIAVDDGSTDDTPKILQSYGSKIISRRIPNSGGPSKPRNIGIEMATGDYVAFLDADDHWFDHKLTLVAQAIEDHPAVGLIGSDYFMRLPGAKNPMKRHGALIHRAHLLNYNEPLRVSPLKLLLYENFIGTPSAVVVKKSAALAAGGFDENVRFVEDLNFYLRMALQCSFLVIGEPLIYKREHGSNMSSQLIPLYEGHRTVLNSFFEKYGVQLRERSLDKDYITALVELEIMLGNLRFDNGEHGTAFGHFGKALSLSRSPLDLMKALWSYAKKFGRVATHDLLSKSRLRAIFTSKN